MRILVLYQSDLAPQSRVSPGGINSVVRSDLERMPADWQVEVWGVGDRDATRAGAVTPLRLGDREVPVRALVTAGAAERRRVPLSPRYAAALVAHARAGGLTDGRWDLVVAHRAEHLGALQLVRPRARMPRSVLFLHSTSEFAVRSMARPKAYLHLRGERLGVAQADAVALISNASMPYYRTRYAAFADRFRWIPNGVAVARFAGGDRAGWRAATGFAPTDRVLAYHGRYNPEKGIHRMLETLRLLRRDGAPWHLVCAGVGPLAGALADAASGWGAGHVHDVGYKTAGELPDLLAGADLGLLASDYEGLSTSLLEALAAGLPVVTTEAGDNREVLQHLSAELVSPGADPADVAATVRRAWPHREALSARAPAVAARFSMDARAARIRALFDEVVGRTVP